MNAIPYTRPSITDLEVAYAADAARTGWGPRCNEYVERFEAGFAAHVGVRHAVATSSCTGAMHLGLAALGIGRGDEVILGDINWIATAAPAVHLGARPVFVDVLPDSWCVDPSAVEAAITPRTRAIVAVHLYGNLCDMDALLAIGRRHGIAVIEDAAEAIGSAWHGRRAGSMGTFGTFSFHGTKTLTTGEGGMLVTDSEALHERVQTLANHGRRRGQARQFWPEAVGFKYKMSNLQAAIGCAQLERVDALVAARRRVFLAYREALADLPLTMNPEPPGTVNGFWMPTIVVDEAAHFDREALVAAFTRERIDARVFFWPLSELPMFERRPCNVVAQSIHRRAMNLPVHPEMTEADVLRVASIVREALASASVAS
ncbi:MAG: glutamine--scyllo-inositol aminotransferase [Pseudomonadota bacterium]|jgi:perosamine synthetase